MTCAQEPVGPTVRGRQAVSNGKPKMEHLTTQFCRKFHVGRHNIPRNAGTGSRKGEGRKHIVPPVHPFCTSFARNSGAVWGIRRNAVVRVAWTCRHSGRTNVIVCPTKQCLSKRTVYISPSTVHLCRQCVLFCSILPIITVREATNNERPIQVLLLSSRHGTRRRVLAAWAGRTPGPRPMQPSTV